MQITERVGHIALRVPDLDAAVSFHGEVLGLVETTREGPVSYLTSCNDRHHELILIEQGQGQRGYEHIALQVADAGAPLDAVRIGHIDGDPYDTRCMWANRRQIGSDGAVLVRPDRFVAWRNPSASQAPAEELANALSQILARPIGVPTPA